MSRRYTIEEPAFTAVANMNLIEIKGASGKVLSVVRWWWRPTDNTLATAQVLYTRCRLLPATVTDATGSPNASPSIVPNDGGDASATATALTKGTTQASTNGTARVYDSAGAHIYNGYDQQIEEGITVKSGEAFVFELVSGSVQNSPGITVGAEFDEIG